MERIKTCRICNKNFEGWGKYCSIECKKKWVKEYGHKWYLKHRRLKGITRRYHKHFDNQLKTYNQPIIISKNSNMPNQIILISSNGEHKVFRQE